MGVFPRGFGQSIVFSVFYWLYFDQARILVYENQYVNFAVNKSIIDNQISEILSPRFRAMELSFDILCPFVVSGL